MKFMKKRKIRRIASLFMAVLMVAALMPGSITNTKADDKTAESGVVVDAGTWENNERITTWDFSKYSGSSSLTLAEGDEVGRIKVAAGTAYVKTKGAGLSAQKTKDAVIAVPVDPTATSATLTLKFSTLASGSAICFTSMLPRYPSAVATNSTYPAAPEY